jgi:hypothetical protein
MTTIHEMPATVDAGAIAEAAAATLKPELFEPEIRRVADALYGTLLEAVQDYRHAANDSPPPQPLRLGKGPRLYR